MRTFKVLRESGIHHGLVLKKGLNVDPVPFNPSGSGQPGGIHFASREVLAFLDLGLWLCEVALPVGARVYREPRGSAAWKADRLILGEKRLLDLSIVGELVAEGANIRAWADWPLRWAATKGLSDWVEFYIFRILEYVNPEWYHWSK